MSEVVETTDLESVERILSSASGTSVRINPRGQRRGIRWVHTPLSAQVRFTHTSFTMSCDLTGNPFGVLAIGHLRDGRMTYRSDGSDRPLRPGDVFLAAQPDHPHIATVEDAELEAAFIDPALLSQVADGEPGRTRQPVRVTGYQPVSPQAARAWQATYAYIRDTVLASPDAAGQPLLASTAARLLAVTALATFPTTALTDPAIEDRHDAHPATLRRAMAFIDEHAQADITIADIAAAASVTIRAVQLAFRRHLDTTPTEYLRRVRLDHARHDLLAADPARDSVTAVAYRWGFPSPGRFAAYYRAAYGVPPGDTLRRR
jgi:AraC-like DNA-binding protein